MNILVLKLLMAPVIIGGASLAGRRWGPIVSGWLIGLPLTSGPVIFFVALSHSPSFAASTALGTLSGGLSLVSFCLAYAWLSIKVKWQFAIVGSILCFTAVTVLMQNMILPLPVIFSLVLLVIILGLLCMPRYKQPELPENNPGKWDLPARIIIGTSFILGLTGIAPFIGARLTGLLSTIPLYTAILVVFAQRLQGHVASTSLLRGLLYGLFGFSGFYLVLSIFFTHINPNLPVLTGIGPAFGAAIASTLIIQGISFLAMRHFHI